ncbi:hypothetical protein [Sphingomonas sp. 3-13AW]|uniref:hypothetical protein n=1 Tax=Sphingomonas sp. 3-13AW TaxID=3050450 RepID=UPI003BB54453
MRTNTATFRRNTFKALRRQGVSSAKTRLLVEKIRYRLRYQDALPVGTEILVSMDEAEAQRVAFVKDGLVLVCLDWDELRDLQPLVNTTPTPRQLALCEEMERLISAIFRTMDEGEQAFATEHGEPHTEADCEARRRFVKDFAPYREVLASYEAAKAESLAINPNVEASIIDPERSSFWYEWHREAFNYRPSGFRTLAMIDREMETMPRHIEAEAA